jgi:hypothetical protein
MAHELVTHFAQRLDVPFVFAEEPVQNINLLIKVVFIGP